MALLSMCCAFSSFLFIHCTGNPNLVMALAGNKADLASKKKIEAEV